MTISIIAGMKRRDWSKLWNKGCRPKIKKWNCTNFKKWKIKSKNEFMHSQAKSLLTALIWGQKNIVPRLGSTRWCLSEEKITELSMTPTLMSFPREIQNLFTCPLKAPDLVPTPRFLRPRASRAPKNTSSTKSRNLYSMTPCTSLTSKARRSRKDKIDLQISTELASPRLLSPTPQTLKKV